VLALERQAGGSLPRRWSQASRNPSHQSPTEPPF
jgi:hypothetical protein